MFYSPELGSWCGGIGEQNALDDVGMADGGGGGG